MTEQPTALRLAEIIGGDCAAELRRLHEEVTEQGRLLSMSAERELALLARIDRLEKQLGEAVWNYSEKVRANQELLEALEGVMYWDNGKPEWEDARAAIAKATGEQA